MSVREARDLVNIAKDTASRAFRELEAKGFLKRNVCGSFNWKAKQATTWILTTYEFDDQPASKEFARWVPEKKNHGPNSMTRCPGSRTLKAIIEHLWSVCVLRLGPWTKFGLFLGPNPRHPYSLPCHAQFLGLCATPESSVAGCVETPHIAARPATRLAAQSLILFQILLGGVGR